MRKGEASRLKEKWLARAGMVEARNIVYQLNELVAEAEGLGFVPVTAGTRAPRCASVCGR